VQKLAVSGVRVGFNCLSVDKSDFATLSQKKSLFLYVVHTISLTVVSPEYEDKMPRDRNSQTVQLK
jgi:hypothetical protein